MAMLFECKRNNSSMSLVQLPFGYTEADGTILCNLTFR